MESRDIMSLVSRHIFMYLSCLSLFCLESSLKPPHLVLSCFIMTVYNWSGSFWSLLTHCVGLAIGLLYLWHTVKCRLLVRTHRARFGDELTIYFVCWSSAMICNQQLMWKSWLEKLSVNDCTRNVRFPFMPIKLGFIQCLLAHHGPWRHVDCWLAVQFRCFWYLGLHRVRISGLCIAVCNRPR